MKFVVCIQLIMILQIGCGNETQEHAQALTHEPADRNQSEKYVHEINTILQKAKQLKEEIDAIEQRQSQAHLTTKDGLKPASQERKAAQKQVNIEDFAIQNKKTVQRIEELEGELCSIRTRYSMVSYLMRKTDRIENCYGDVCDDIESLFSKAEKFEAGFLKLIELLEDNQRKNNRKIKKLKNKILLLTESNFTQEDACSDNDNDGGLADESH